MLSANVGVAYREIVDKYYDETCDDTIPHCRALGDFAMRGQESYRSATKSSAAWLLSFVNTATVPAIPYLEKYYNCDISVSQPPKYTGGAAHVILKTPDGTELFNANTDSFPVRINLNNIFAVSKGTVVVTYTVYIPEEVEDLEGNKTIQQVEAVDEYKYDVTFTDASN